MLDKSKSSVQDSKSTRNQTSVFTTELNMHVHESNSVRISSLFTHIELKVPSGSVLTTRAKPVFKSSIGSAFPNRTERVCLSVEPLEQIQCSNQNTNQTGLPQN